MTPLPPQRIRKARLPTPRPDARLSYPLPHSATSRLPIILTPFRIGPVRGPRPKNGSGHAMKRLRFVMVGGFLGAGKTTALARLARFYTGRGEKVGLVTNDQAQDLVDTHSLREQGFPVAEVAGACFCCKFNDLLDKVGQLEASQRPNVILAEPVGSCTDLVATVVQPLKDLYGSRFSVAPYPVLFKPSHGLKILRNEAGAGFSPKAAYIFRKQLEEADAILINRIDELTPAQVEQL